MTNTKLTSSGLIFYSKGLLHETLSGLYRVLRKPARPIAQILNRKNFTANQVTGVRTLSPLLFIALYMWGPYQHAWLILVLFLCISFTDLVDGIMAQELENKTQSQSGVAFDSLTDKIFIVSLLILNLIYLNGFETLFTLIVIGETGYAILALLYITTSWMINGEASQAFEKTRSTIWGKAKMVLEVLTCGLVIIFLNWQSPALRGAIEIVGWSALAFLVFSFLSKLKTALS